MQLNYVAMPIWKLTPRDLAHPSWQASTHKDVAIVRASSERDAREIAVAAFWIAVEGVPVAGKIYPPWRHEDLVDCEQVLDSEFSEDGDAAVLVPEHY